MVTCQARHGSPAIDSPHSRIALNPPTSVKYQIEIVWQETPASPSEPSEGNIIITVVDITTIPDESGLRTRQLMAVAKLTWGRWEANFGCTYYLVSIS